MVHWVNPQKGCEGMTEFTSAAHNKRLITLPLPFSSGPFYLYVIGQLVLELQTCSYVKQSS
jgi:hypothetical protein